MMMNTLEKLRNSLKHDQFEVEVDQEVGKRARLAVRRMRAIR
jgi:quinolinate synthase